MVEEFLLIDNSPPLLGKCKENEFIERMNLREFERDILKIWDGICTFLRFLKRVIKYASEQVRTAKYRTPLLRKRRASKIAKGCITIANTLLCVGSEK